MKSPISRPTADEIADMADSGRDISEFFTNQGTMKQPLTRVNVDFTPDMLQELDKLAAELCVSRQSAIKSCLRQALDQHLLAKRRQP
jgi:hypothetical protein